MSNAISIGRRRVSVDRFGRFSTVFRSARVALPAAVTSGYAKRCVSAGNVGCFRRISTKSTLSARPRRWKPEINKTPLCGFASVVVPALDEHTQP